MSTQASELLSQYLLIRWRTRGKAKRDPPKNALFISRWKKRLASSSVNGFYRELSQELGFHIHPHRFRHTFGVFLAESGVDFLAIQKLLGHSSKLGVTDVYTHVSEQWLFKEYSKAFK